ncbi:hypothetical protein SNE510_45100 [Streptomyces sp. NE5-10]|nr:hypothetical protein SNE510_45100 [Streptomyces sp. NE5-10]
MYGFAAGTPWAEREYAASVRSGAISPAGTKATISIVLAVGSGSAARSSSPIGIMTPSASSYAFPFSAGATSRPAVSAPVTGEEVEARAAPADLAFPRGDIAPRLERYGDLLGPLFDAGRAGDVPRVAGAEGTGGRTGREARVPPRARAAGGRSCSRRPWRCCGRGRRAGFPRRRRRRGSSGTP